MSPAQLALAVVAGVLTSLSPCMLAITPIVFAGAAGKHRLAPAALALGVATAFTGAGLLLATVGFSLGLDGESLRPAFGVMMALVGLVILTPRLQAGVEYALAPIAGWAASRSAATPGNGLAGQFGVGALLGAVWSPCVGPTIGAASLLASRGENLPGVALIMFLFGLGAAAPLLVIGVLSRAGLARLRGGLSFMGRYGRIVLGACLIAAGLLVVSGLDKLLETVITDLSPDWLVDLTTRY